MSGLVTIELKRLHFFGYHGLHPEEKKKGNEFEVNLSVSFSSETVAIQHLSDTIDYERLFAIVNEEMQRPRELLETLAMEMAEKIHLAFSAISKITVHVCKQRVPIAGFTGTAEVTFSKDY